MPPDRRTLAVGKCLKAVHRKRCVPIECGVHQRRQRTQYHFRPQLIGRPGRHIDLKTFQLAEPFQLIVPLLHLERDNGCARQPQHFSPCPAEHVVDVVTADHNILRKAQVVFVVIGRQPRRKPVATVEICVQHLLLRIDVNETVVVGLEVQRAMRRVGKVRGLRQNVGVRAGFDDKFVVGIRPEAASAQFLV